MRQYKVVRGSDVVHLVIEVNHLLQQGWVPTGGVCVNKNDDYGGGSRYSQAMVNWEVSNE